VLPLHGEPGAVSSPLGSSFYPPAPLLPGHKSEWRERELFWIIKHGIRNTAMPSGQRFSRMTICPTLREG